MALRLSDHATATARRVRQAAEAKMPDWTRDLATWVERDSASGHRRLIDAMGEHMAHDLRRLGWEVVLLEGASGATVHATMSGTGTADVALLGHHDTVYAPSPTGRRRLEVTAGRAIGPGTADMKGGLLTGAWAGFHLANSDRPFGRLHLLSVPDEETRTGAPELLDRITGVDAVLCLECGRPDGAVVSARKGGLWVTVQATGRPAHAGVAPDDGRNAVTAMAHEAVRVEALDGIRTGLTVNVTSLHGGAAVNIIPDEAKMRVDVRGITREDLRTAAREIGRFGVHEGVALRIAHEEGFPALERTSAVATLACAAGRLGASLETRVPETSTGGVSDACWTADAGVVSLDGLGPVGALDHTSDEWLDLGSVPSRIGVVAGLVAAVDDGLLDSADHEHRPQ